MRKAGIKAIAVNPCKMCMPLGAVTALKGLEGGMIILHGSQGCSTYIRRHMAGHYNEPIDIASSSLTEEGTVYGGEANLKNGLSNIIKVYKPRIIGVATTCLAETIGEDIARITEEFVCEGKHPGVRIVPIPTPGYGGTQFEGYYTALKCILKAVAVKAGPNKRVNIIPAPMSPGEIRSIKRILEAFELDYILFPDISETLDAPFREEYVKLQPGGTAQGDIETTAGAAATIEMGLTVPDELSPGKYLQEKFGVPLYKCAIPVGLESTDAFVRILSTVSGRPIPAGLAAERGRLVDCMIDSHKYNAGGRAVIYGEPEQVLAVTGVCLENGIKPVLACTGAKSEKLLRLLGEGLSESHRQSGQAVAMDGVDFQEIRELAVKREANLLLGNSDGRSITEKEGIPIVRMGFPIHDRVGGQRLEYTGYTGTMKLLDDITNTLLDKKHSSYRRDLFEAHYKKPADKRPEDGTDFAGEELREKTLKHPCFSQGACRYARIHLPVAPGCNISCNYCVRKYDCPNESRPGVCSRVLTPEEALDRFIKVREAVTELKVVGIAGPGDALADYSRTMHTIRLIRQHDPAITFCLSTNGLLLPYHAKEIADAGVTHVTITVNAVEPEIGEKIYGEIRLMGAVIKGRQAATILIGNQLLGLRLLSEMGIVCKVNTVMIKGVNDGHIEEVIRKVKECGAFISNIMPLIPAKGSVFESMPQTSNRELVEIRRRCEPHMRQMHHCRQCRADAVGTLDEDISARVLRDESTAGELQDGSAGARVFAVATKSGVLVDEHFGHAEEFRIYGLEAGKVIYKGSRKTVKYCDGAEDCEDGGKISKAIKAVCDCDGVIVMRIGYEPMKRLEERGIRVIQTCGGIDEAVKRAAEEIGPGAPASGRPPGISRSINNKAV